MNSKRQVWQITRNLTQKTHNYVWCTVLLGLSLCPLLSHLYSFKPTVLNIKEQLRQQVNEPMARLTYDQQFGTQKTTKKILRVKSLLLHSKLLAFDVYPHLFKLFFCFLYINKASLHFLGQSADSILLVTGEEKMYSLCAWGLDWIYGIWQEGIKMWLQSPCSCRSTSLVILLTEHSSDDHNIPPA